MIKAGNVRLRVNEVICPGGTGVCTPSLASFSETGFAGAFGGVDVKLGNRIDLRLVQVDHNPIRVSDNTLHNFRIGIGLSLNKS